MRRRGCLARLAAVELRLNALTEELNPEPYQTDPGALLTRNRKGKITLGYDAGTARELGSEYAGFEDVFRGPETKVRELLKPYPGIFRDQQPVVDVGCGRGEFLDLAAAAGITVFGVDSDAGMVERAQSKGHAVACADANEYLESMDDASLGGIFSAQVIEHMVTDQLHRLLRASYQKLRSGGVFVAETVNPHSVQAAKVFWLDLTHRLPIFPEALLVHCRAIGFRRAEIFFPFGTGELRYDRRHADSYAVIAYK